MNNIANLESYLSNPYDLLNKEQIGGFRVISIPVPGFIQTSRTAFVFGGGAMADQKPGEQHFLEHLLLDGGDELQTADEQDGGYWMRGETGLSSTYYGFESKAHNFDRTLDFYFSKLFYEREFNHENLEYERKRIISEYHETYLSSNALRYERRKMRFLYGDNPAGKTLSPIGELETIQNFSSQRALELFQEFCFPENCTIVFIGNHNDYQTLVERLKGIQVTGRKPYEPMQFCLARSARTLTLKSGFFVSDNSVVIMQKNLAKGFSNGEIRIAEHILSNRISKATEDTLYSFSSTFGDLRGAGANQSIKVTFTCRSNQVNEFTNLINQVSTEEVTSDELENAKLLLISVQKQQNDFPSLDGIFTDIILDAQTGQKLFGIKPLIDSIASAKLKNIRSIVSTWNKKRTLIVS
jgi:predicted Zn-dependent peptidase